MNEALVARVRYHIEKASFMGLKEAESTLLLGEAADAIEALSKQILEMGQVGKFLLDVHKINSKMVDPESVPTDSEWWSHYKALLELLYLPRWIPVTEQLPEHGWYLAYGPIIKIEVLHFNSAEEVWSSERYYNIEVTHWMPLPEPPKER